MSTTKEFEKGLYDEIGNIHIDYDIGNVYTILTILYRK